MNTRKKTLLLIATAFCGLHASAANQWDNPDTIFVSRDGTGHFRTIREAIDVCRAFMEYKKVIYVKKGVYKEKLVVPSYLTNIQICGEDRDNTIITWDDHANIKDETWPGKHTLGTFRTYTLKVEGTDISLKNITIENNAAKLGQAVALHTEGDRLIFVNCRFLGNQDTVYTGIAGTRLLFKDCYIEGTTDFIFGPSIAWFENCEIKSKTNSYVTAASTPNGQAFGYVFNNCRLTATEAATKCYLGRPWRPYAHTLFMNCEIGSHIRTEGWHNWGKTSNEQTTRYEEYNNRGAGSQTSGRVAWSKQLTAKEAKKVTMEAAFSLTSAWTPDVR